MRKIIATLLLALSSVAPTFAQDTTPEVTPIVEETPAPVEPAPEQPTGETLVGRIAGYVAAFVAGIGVTATLALATLPRLLSQVRNDRAMLSLIEGLTNSVPADRLPQLATIGTTLIDAGEIIREVTDGVPVTSKPPAA